MAAARDIGCGQPRLSANKPVTPRLTRLELSRLSHRQQPHHAADDLHELADSLDGNADVLDSLQCLLEGVNAIAQRLLIGDQFVPDLGQICVLHLENRVLNLKK